MKIYLKDIKKILKFEKDECKYLSPFIHKFKKNIKIISVPFVTFEQNNILLFFEFKDEHDQWNISYKQISRSLLV